MSKTENCKDCKYLLKDKCQHPHAESCQHCELWTPIKNECGYAECCESDCAKCQIADIVRLRIATDNLKEEILKPFEKLVDKMENFLERFKSL